MTNHMQCKILSIGGGNMGRAIIGGLVAAGWAPRDILVIDPVADTRRALIADFGVEAEAALNTSIDAQTVLLAVKPQIMAQVASGLASLMNTKAPLFLSIAAGITTAQLQDWLGAASPIVRVMPNTPALVGSGAAVMFANCNATAQQKEAAVEILSAVGIARWVDQESMLDAVTALSGSGPAYFFLILELLEKIGAELGLTPALARELALETGYGACLLARESNFAPAELRAQVTSPGGTTQRALEILNDGNIEALLRQALQGAERRSRELSSGAGE